VFGKGAGLFYTTRLDVAMPIPYLRREVKVGYTSGYEAFELPLTWRGRKIGQVTAYLLPLVLASRRYSSGCI